MVNAASWVSHASEQACESSSLICATTLIDALFFFRYTGGGATRDQSGAGVASIRALNDSDSVFAVEDKEPQPFSFDRVFDPRSSERDVYDAAQANIVNLAQGYSSCVFAYGQTGSGKTHTMTHLNERLLAELFRLKV